VTHPEIERLTAGPAFRANEGLLSLDGLRLYGRVAEALQRNALVRVTFWTRDDDGEPSGTAAVTGIARAVVRATDDAFARKPWAPTDRLWLSGTNEHFLPLHDLTEVMEVEQP